MNPRETELLKRIVEAGEDGITELGIAQTCNEHLPKWGLLDAGFIGRGKGTKRNLWLATDAGRAALAEATIEELTKAEK